MDFIQFDDAGKPDPRGTNKIYYYKVFQFYRNNDNFGFDVDTIINCSVDTASACPNTFKMDNGYSIEIPLAGLSTLGETFFDTFRNKFQTRQSLDEFAKYETEIGLLNQTISPIDLYLSDQPTSLDIFNFFNTRFATADYKPTFNDPITTGQIFEGSASFTPNGIASTIRISDDQFTTTNENFYYSFATDQGKTYLARNKYTIDGQKKLADLAYNQSIAGAYKNGANSVTSISGIVGLFTGATAAGVAADVLGVKMQRVEKENIDNALKDAASASPLQHLAKDNDMSNFLATELKYKFNWVLKSPNVIVARKIKSYYERFGYKWDDFVTFDRALNVDSRMQYNFLEIDNVKDYISANADLDVDVMDLFDQELAKGVRIWHSNIISYRDYNWEKVVWDNTTRPAK